MTALAAIVLVAAVLLTLRRLRRLGAEAATSAAAAHRANERARAAEERLEIARKTMCDIAESLAADGAARTAATYVGPVRALPRPRISEPAPACCVCARHEIGVAIVRASRAPVAGITGERGWHPPFTVRWADA